MGTKYKVSEWYEYKTTGGGYKYHSELRTEWLVVALWKMWRVEWGFLVWMFDFEL